MTESNLGWHELLFTSRWNQHRVGRTVQGSSDKGWFCMVWLAKGPGKRGVSGWAVVDDWVSSLGKGPGNDGCLGRCILGDRGDTGAAGQGARKISEKITQKKWKVARCDNQHSVTHENRVMNCSSLGKGKDRQQVVVGKSSGKSDMIQRSKVPSLYPAWSFDMWLPFLGEHYIGEWGALMGATIRVRSVRTVLQLYPLDFTSSGKNILAVEMCLLCNLSVAM